MLNHTWLKQYTAEAFAAVAIALLLARVERAWSWRSLAMFAAGGTTGFLISNTAPLVSAAGLGGLWLTTITARRLSRLPALAVTTVALGMADGIVYRALANNGNTRAMRSYWRSWYLTLDHGLGDAAEVVWGRFTAELSGLGWGPWWLALALVVVGLVTLWRARLPAVALTPLAIGVELLALGLARSYPFLEPRTSIFYAALLTVTAAAGLATQRLPAWPYAPGLPPPWLEWACSYWACCWSRAGSAQELAISRARTSNTRSPTSLPTASSATPSWLPLARASPLPTTGPTAQPSCPPPPTPRSPSCPPFQTTQTLSWSTSPAASAPWSRPLSGQYVGMVGCG